MAQHGLQGPMAVVPTTIVKQPLRVSVTAHVSRLLPGSLLHPDADVSPLLSPASTPP